MRKIEMVDLRGQYQNIKSEIDAEIQSVIDSAAFVKGGKVVEFQKKLENYFGFRNVIPVGNGTDALMVSLMALDLKPEDEVVVPDFTFIAAAEVVSLLGLKLVLADVDKETFCMTGDTLKRLCRLVRKRLFPCICSVKTLIWSRLCKLQNPTDSMSWKMRVSRLLQNIVFLTEKKRCLVQ